MSEQVKIQQVPVPPKYAPAPVPSTVAIPQPVPVPPKYAPAPVPSTVAISQPVPVPPKYAPAPVPQTSPVPVPQPEPIQVKYAPAPPQPTPPTPVPPTPITTAPVGDTYEDIYGHSDIAPASSLNTEEVMNTRHFIEDIDSLIDDFDKFYNNSHYVTGGFGSAISYTSENCKKSIESLKKFAENNFLQAMNDVGEYESNLNKMKSISEPIVGDFSSIHFNEDGTVVFPSGSFTSENKQTIVTVENLYKRNRKIKQQIESFSKEKIV